MTTNGPRSCDFQQVYLLLATFGVQTLLFFSHTTIHHYRVRSILEGPPQIATADALSFTATNEYPPLEQSAWPLVAEPFRSTTFTASSSVGDLDKDVFMWSFPDGTVLEGR